MNEGKAELFAKRHIPDTFRPNKGQKVERILCITTEEVGISMKQQSISEHTHENWLTTK